MVVSALSQVSTIALLISSLVRPQHARHRTNAMRTVSSYHYLAGPLLAPDSSNCSRGEWGDNTLFGVDENLYGSKHPSKPFNSFPQRTESSYHVRTSRARAQGLEKRGLRRKQHWRKEASKVCPAQGTWWQLLTLESVAALTNTARDSSFPFSFLSTMVNWFYQIGRFTLYPVFCAGSGIKPNRPRQKDSRIYVPALDYNDVKHEGGILNFSNTCP